MGFPRNFLSTPWLPVKQEAAYILDAFTKRKGPRIQSPCLLSDNVERMSTLLPIIKRSDILYIHVNHFSFRPRPRRNRTGWRRRRRRRRRRQLRPVLPAGRSALKPDLRLLHGEPSQHGQVNQDFHDYSRHAPDMP